VLSEQQRLRLAAGEGRGPHQGYLKVLAMSREVTTMEHCADVEEWRKAAEELAAARERIAELEARDN